MSKINEINAILGITESYKAPDRMLEILYDRPKREEVFRQFLELFDYDVDFDWFHEYFQEEHADRKTKKQDFTPQSVATLLTELVGKMGGSTETYEPCAGTGGITITKWNRDRRQHLPWDYYPSDYCYTCEELSDRAIPFLLFNLLIRGMNAIVVHCDVLTREAYGVFFVQNDTDNHLGFSSLNVMPYSEGVAEFLSVDFVEERYEALVETLEFPGHLRMKMAG